MNHAEFKCFRKNGKDWKETSKERIESKVKELKAIKERMEGPRRDVETLLVQFLPC